MSERYSEHVLQGDGRLERSRSLVGVVVIVGFLLTAVVGLSSSASPWLAEDGAGSSVPATVGNMLALVLAAGLSVLVGLLWILSPRGSKARRSKRPESLPGDEVAEGLRWGSLVLIGGIVAFVFLVGALWFLLDQATVAPPSPVPTLPSGDADGPVLPRPAPGAAASPAFRWFALGLIGSFLLLLPLGLVVRHRQRAFEGTDEADDLPESVARALGDSIDQIETDPDSRRAIIRAYARMEGTFDDAGVPRRPSEAPLEYVGRALRGLEVSPTATGRLAALFERARFSRHAVGSQTREEALDALRDVERELQRPPS